MAAPLAGYTRPQRRVIRAIDREADLRGYRGRRGRTLRLSAYETGLVESTLRNLPYGSGSSVNWRQETAESYPGVDRMNLRGSVRRYFDEAEGFYRRGIRPGVLAQATQRSAFPGRYAERRGQALGLLAATRRIGGSVAGGRVGGGVSVTQPSVSRGSVEPGGAGVSALLAALREKERPQVPSAGVAPPSFSAHAAMPAGYRRVASSAPAPQGPRLSDLLEAVEGLSGAAPPRSTVTPGQMSGGAQGGAQRGSGGAGGLQARADGWYGTKTLAQTAEEIAKDMGIPWTGKRDRKYTDSGNISDHWVGNRRAWADDFDVPGLDSATGHKLARRIAKAYGVKYVPNSYASGGTVKVGKRTYRLQLLFGSGVGHADHVHAGWERIL